MQGGFSTKEEILAQVQAGTLDPNVAATLISALDEQSSTSAQDSQELDFDVSELAHSIHERPASDISQHDDDINMEALAGVAASAAPFQEHPRQAKLSRKERKAQKKAFKQNKAAMNARL